MTTTTTNYSWVKPDVGASDDVWGGLINADLDSIDATVKTVSNTAMGDNRIINSDMRIDQRNNGASGTAVGVYTVDRWVYSATQPTKGTWGQVSSVLLGFPYCLGFTSSSAYAPTASDTFQFRSYLEGDAISDFGWGTANAQPVTLSFWAKSTLTGTFSGSIRDYTPSRSYPFTFSLPTANTWTKVAITVPGDTSGAWVLSGNAGALMLTFELGGGATYRGSANAWAATGNYAGVTGAVSIVATNAANFQMTGVKLEIGSVATSFNRQSLAKSLADCRRYFQTSNFVVSGYYTAGGIIYNSSFLPVQMRAAPTVVFSGQSYTNASAVATSGSSNTLWATQLTVTATGLGIATGNATFSAEL